MAAVDYFLKIEGIDGESTDKAHIKWIEVDSFSFGASQTGSFSAGGGGGAGKVQFQDFHFTSRVSKASPNMFLKCATGEHIKEGTISCRKAGGDQQKDFMFIKMTDVMVTSYQTGGSGNVVPTDQVSLNFTKIEFSYAPQDPTTGQLLPAVITGWDLKANKKV